MNRIQINKDVSIAKIVTGLWRLKHWNMSAQQILVFVEQNIELGMSTMDHAWVYGSEAPFGQALKLDPAIREKIEIISKCGIKPIGKTELHASNTNHYSSSYQTITESLNQSLSDLNTDYVDIYLLHRPDYLMDITEVAKAFKQIKKQGKAKAFGVSNFSKEQFELLQSALDEPLVTNQVEFSPYQTELLTSGLPELMQKTGQTIMAWSCLAGGKLFDSNNNKAKRLLDTIKTIQKQIGAKSIEQVVYAWMFKLPFNVIPMTGTGNIERIKLAANAYEYTLSHEQWYQILEASNGHAVA
ncbi:MAG: aldo/keto reductase [Saccharospirillaceae bacterium]|nr:aldo/keto reductase [Pseudomonadales bacterium]NRB78483.1 aldo/keto reductase [Saccharospirillaceae bacterium]